VELLPWLMLITVVVRCEGGTRAGAAVEMMVVQWCNGRFALAQS